MSFAIIPVKFIDVLKTSLLDCLGNYQWALYLSSLYHFFKWLQNDKIPENAIYTCQHITSPALYKIIVTHLLVTSVFKNLYGST